MLINYKIILILQELFLKNIKQPHYIRKLKPKKKLWVLPNVKYYFTNLFLIQLKKKHSGINKLTTSIVKNSL